MFQCVLFGIIISHVAPRSLGLFFSIQTDCNSVVAKQIVGLLDALLDELLLILIELVSNTYFLKNIKMLLKKYIVRSVLIFLNKILKS